MALCTIFGMKPWLEKIRELMSAQDMTQEALGNKIDRGQSWVNHKLSGRRKTNVEDIVLIAKALNIEPAELFENLSNPDKLRENFLEGSIAEPSKEYEYQPFCEVEHKFSKLKPAAQKTFLKQAHSLLDNELKKQ